MSVFRASNATAAWPTSTDPFADGPTERLASADSDGPPDPPPRRGFVFAVLLAMLALLVSAASGLLAWRALGRAEQAYARPSPTVSGLAPVVAYAEETLRIRAGCSTVTFVDLDEPRVNVPGATGDLRYDSGCGDAVSRLRLGPGAAAGSQARDADAGEDGCAEAIRTSPLTGDASVPVQKGAVLCVLTGAADAGPSGAGPSGAGPSEVEPSASVPQSPASGTAGPAAPSDGPTGADTGGTPGVALAGVRLVRVEITEVTEDGTADLRATSWVVR